MADSKIHICNLALASLGAGPIRSFDENNKRARMCDTFFDSTKNYLLSKFDWPFARGFQKVQPLATQDWPDGLVAYGLPSDCKRMNDLHPKGSRDYWEIYGNTMVCKKTVDEGAWIYYTIQIEDTSLFTETFSNLLSTALAVRMAPAITQDKALTKALYEQYRAEQLDVQEAEANEGNDYRSYDENPNNDTFCYPEGDYVEYEDLFITQTNK
jgi:hypothetical protein